ncbi:hypothetical protein PIB30_094507 [Stylosanthes scabra]|uniref:Uncharacterized protein n=1 Tax=Stylosanthes scabra TaxID=79078 RepID=A0ABU6ZUA4_9FABA|nr:hypothetical protein [Stylosanthes scabra]
MDPTSYPCLCGKNPSMCYAFIVACESRLRVEEILHKPEDQHKKIELDVHDLVKSVKDFDDVFWALQYMATVGVRSRPKIPGSETEWTGRFKIKGIRRIPTTKIDEVKTYIRDKCGVLVTIHINADFYSRSVAMPYERDRRTLDVGFHNVKGLKIAQELGYSRIVSVRIGEIRVLEGSGTIVLCNM